MHGDGHAAIGGNHVTIVLPKGKNKYKQTPGRNRGIYIGGDRMTVNGTLINYYFHCKRQCYLHGNRLNLEDNSESGYV